MPEGHFRTLLPWVDDEIGGSEQRQLAVGEAVKRKDVLCDLAAVVRHHRHSCRIRKGVNVGGAHHTAKGRVERHEEVPPAELHALPRHARELRLQALQHARQRSDWLCGTRDGAVCQHGVLVALVISVAIGEGGHENERLSAWQ